MILGGENLIPDRLLAVGDFNQDGKPDLAVANNADNSVSILLGNGEGTFRPKIDFPVGAGVQGIVVEDFNGDGKPDVATANFDASTITILLNTSH